jgi:integration host factor subunit alpha
MGLGKSDIVININAKTQLSRESSSVLLEYFISLLKIHINTHNVKISNFGKFKVKISPERTGRNPKNKVAYPIIERKKVSFYASHRIKNLIN